MDEISQDWASRAAVPQHVVQMLNNFPSTLHPMSQLSAAVTAMNSESKFVKAYSEGVSKTKYWEVRARLLSVVSNGIGRELGFWETIHVHPAHVDKRMKRSCVFLLQMGGKKKGVPQ